MGRSLSTLMRMASQKLSTGEVYIALVKISHPNLSDILLSQDGQDTVIGADTYVSYPFDIDFPDESEEQISTAIFTCDNVDRTVYLALSAVDDALDFDVSTALVSQAGTKEIGPVRYKLRVTVWDPLVIKGTLQLVGPINAVYPGHTFNPSNFPAYFAAQQ